MGNIIRRNNRRDMLSQLHEEFNRFLTPFDIRATLDWPEESLGQWVPSIDVKEEKDHYLIHADVPGVKASDIEVHMQNGVLTIKGKRETESKDQKENYLRVERSSGSFMRQITFPDAIDAGKIDAKCKDGVLDVVLPKASNGAAHKVDVKQG
jgi:HSP20 family protein